MDTITVTMPNGVEWHVEDTPEARALLARLGIDVEQ